MGLVDEIKNIIEESGVRVVEMSDIDSNPRLSSVYEGQKICRKEDINLVVALGGGSTMDCAKVIAAAAKTEDEPQFFLWGTEKGEKKIFNDSLDTIMLPTMASTGTELNNTAVIMNEATKSKTYCEAICLFPTITIIDPEIATSTPVTMTIWATMDILSHLFEYYFNGRLDCLYQLRFSESLIMACMECLELIIRNPKDVRARGEMAWISAMAWGGLTKIGRGAPDMSCHTIGEGLVPYFDLHHGATMGVTTSRWMKHVYRKHPTIFARFARNVFGIVDNNDNSAADKAFNAFINWLRYINAPDTLNDLTEAVISDELLLEIAQRVRNENAVIGTLSLLETEDIVTIYRDMRIPLISA